jgi:hypothetical protein
MDAIVANLRKSANAARGVAYLYQRDGDAERAADYQRQAERLEAQAERLSKKEVAL